MFKLRTQQQYLDHEIHTFFPLVSLDKLLLFLTITTVIYKTAALDGVHSLHMPPSHTTRTFAAFFFSLSRDTRGFYIDLYSP